MTKDTNRWGPLSGLLFVAFAVATFAVVGGMPDAKKDSAREIVAYYQDHGGAAWGSVFLTVIGCVALVFFCGYLRSVLDGEVLPTVAFAGGVILTTGLAIDATLVVTLMETHSHIDPAAVQALSALFNNDYIPFVLGATLILSASGLAIVRNRTPLPRWLGWVGVVLGVLGLTPAGFVTFLGGGVWILVASVLLWARAGGAPQVESAVPSPGTAM
jgi:hypothetical protein